MPLSQAFLILFSPLFIPLTLSHRLIENQQVLGLMHSHRSSIASTPRPTIAPLPNSNILEASPTSIPTLEIKPTQQPTPGSTSPSVAVTQPPASAITALENTIPASSPQPIFSPTPLVISQPSMEVVIWNHLNKWRANQGLSSLERSAEVCQLTSMRVSQLKSDFSHNGLQSLINSISYQKYGENIYWSTSLDPQKVIDDWSNSQSHRATMAGDFKQGCLSEKEGYVSLILIQ